MTNVVAASHRWLLNTWNMASPTEQLILNFYLIFSNLNLISYLWLAAAILDRHI